MYISRRNNITSNILQSLCIVAVLTSTFQSILTAKIYRSACRRDAVFKATDRDKKLTLNPANILLKTSALRLPHCAKYCTATFNCRSLNFKQANTENCQILDIDKNNASVTIESAVGWIHYEPVSEVGPRCRLVTCNAGYRCNETCNLLAGSECIDINECNSNPCQNGATCVNAVNSYSCTCVPGYSGTNCQTDVNECSSSPCKNGATCNDLFNKYTCTCTLGYTGTNCETDVDECASNPCANGITCTNQVGSFKCNCPQGYSGTLCNILVNECESNPCQNGGTCHDIFTRYMCVCPAGYTGTNCQTATSICQTSPCVNGGTCVHAAATRVCLCPSGYAGETCQTVAEPCSNYNQLNEANRAHSYVATGSAICDRSLVAQWYRFTGAAGGNMRTSCVDDYGTKYRCSTHGGGWLNGGLPSVSDGEVVRTVCFAWRSSCCTWAKIVKVKYCAAGYYVYFLKSPGSCSLRFCGSA